MAETPEMRKLFRRITVGPNEKLRTASQIISQLDLATISSNLSPLVIQERHDQAFDVEPVTQEFFRQYHAVFEQVEGLIRGIRDKDRKRLFTQRLFNRLMFIAFIQKKGWLQFGGHKNQDYLNALWSDYKKNGNKEMGFYYERLYTLFFHGLGADTDVNATNINRGGVSRDYIGKVPYLNGGLFEEDEDEKNGGIKVPDEAIRTILEDLFNHFNFTVTEATPLDIEVAVDPEMLGRIFEELVTGRHETGAYYTPKPIVSFMCREALKGYLESQLPEQVASGIASFIDDHDPRGLKDAEAALEALRSVRVCDPACGSGAYLLGMLHELMALRRCLFNSKSVDGINEYERKLEIIERNLYGVDLDQFAVNIARLRLWLSLAVEFDGPNPKPLPNLRFEIEEGDSLSAPGPEPAKGTMGFMRDAVVKEFTEAKAKYIKAHGSQKKAIEKRVLELKNSITTWTHKAADSIDGFDWAVEFAEVFQKGGFDVVVANPPYVRQEIIKDQKPTLKAVFPTVYTGVADLYVYFYARALQILKSGGMLAFISSNKWFRAKYGEKLRDYVSRTCSIRSITDFGDLPVFKSATAYPMIFIAKNQANHSEGAVFTQPKTLESPYPDVLAVVNKHGKQLPMAATNGTHWTLADSASSSRLEQMVAASVPLGEYIDNQIYYGVKTGLNAAFFIDGETKRKLIAQDARSAEIIEPLAQGKDIRRWCLAKRDQWLIVTPIGIEIKRYPAVLNHLKQWQKELTTRYDKGNHWWELRACDYYDLFSKPKIVYPIITSTPRFCFDRTGSFINDKAFLIPSTDLFLLGALNSYPMWTYLQAICSSDRGGFLELRAVHLAKVPIPKASQSEQKAISELVQKCIDKKGEDCEQIEELIDRRVALLFGLKLEDFPIKPQSPTTKVAAV
jgi:type I restriction-modification system DNA methylase subunit